MRKILQLKSQPYAAVAMQRLTTCGATIVVVTMACGGLAYAQSLSLGGIKANVSVGAGGVSANVGLGGTRAVGTGTNSASGTPAAPGVQVDVGVGQVLGHSTPAKPVTVKPVPVKPAATKPVPSKHIPAKPTKPVAIAGPASVLGVDTNVAGLDVVADVLEFNGNLLDVCIGSCRDTTRGGGHGGGDDGGGGAGTGGGGGGDVPVVFVPVLPVTPVTPGAPGKSGTPVSGTGAGNDGDCSDFMTTSVAAAMSDLPQNGNPGPSFEMSTADLNLPIHNVELRCSAGGNAQVFNGFSVVDSKGQKIGIVHDSFLTDTLKIRRIQFQGLDQRCFGLSNGVYKVKGASLIVDVPASFVYQ